MHLVHSTEFPYTSFVVLDTGTCLVAESGFDSLLVKLKSFYTPRKAAKIEVHIKSILLVTVPCEGEGGVGDIEGTAEEQVGEVSTWESTRTTWVVLVTLSRT